MALVRYDDKSWMIDSKRILILSAAIHYFRLPAAEWPEALDKAKQAGCNTVETYVAWNFHEQREGTFEFSGDQDLGAFIRLCGERGLYVIVRPGPYICSEWDFGGLPWWLTAKGQMAYRSSDPAFLAYVDRYFDQLAPIIRENQATIGGSVIMVQVENEFQAHGIPDQRYMEHLRDGWISRGIEVPLITCYGAVEGAVEFRNFWLGAEEEARRLEERYSGQPKGIGEFWIGWYDYWGGQKNLVVKTAGQLEYRCYEVLREGFTALNYYMFCGGTNFGHWGGRTLGEQTFVTTSYDSDAPLDEYIEPTAKYGSLQLFHTFAGWAEAILASAVEAGNPFGPAPAGLTLKTRKSPFGSITFAANDTGDKIAASLTTESGARLPCTVYSGSILPIASDVRLRPADRGGRSLTLAAFTGYIYDFDGRRGTVYHETGQRSGMLLRWGPGNHAGKPEIRVTGTAVHRATPLPGGLLQIELFHAAYEQTLHIDCEGEPPLEISVLDRRTLLDSIHPARPAGEAADSRSAPVLTNWKYAAEPVEITENDGQSVKRPEPLDFSGFGQFSGHLLYQSQVEASEDRETTVIFPRLEDPAAVYVNGRFAASIRELGVSAASISLRKGINKLALLVQNMGRYNWTRSLGEPKGLGAMPAMDGVIRDLLDGWRLEGAGKEYSLDREIPVLEGRIGLNRILDNADRFDGGRIAGYGVSRLRVNGKPPVMLMENGTAWNDGEARFGVADVSEALLPGTNHIEMDVRGLTEIPRLTLYLYRAADQIKDWTMKTAGDPETGRQWSELPSALPDGAAGNSRLPGWFSAEFRWDAAEYRGAKLKVRLAGMSKGACWVNGFCIGRYWQIGPQTEYKIPVSILKEHNRLKLFDEGSAMPHQVELMLHRPDR